MTPQDQFLGFLIDEARKRGGALDIGDQNGATIATLTVHKLPTRPQDMPRALRPKRKLSKRKRDALKQARRPTQLPLHT